jgi:glyoxylase-like metal-dependent hydrolase (beta-lactamase superfamily II)
VTSTFEAAEGIRAVDSMMCGRERVTSCYLVEAEEPALVETGPTTSVDAVRAGLANLGVGPNDLAHIVVTHIHLDHAGGAGSLSPHFPKAKVWVHERGAPHLEDPTKLMASATRVYGEENLLRMFGAVEPVPSDRLRSVAGGDLISLGQRELEAIYTPGHASHHVALRDSRTGVIFVGDALGVFLPDVGILRPASPPPEFDLEQAVESIGLILSRNPPAILFSHFGPAEDVSELCELAVDRLRKWTGVVEKALEQSTELAAVVEELRAGTEDELPAPGTAGREQIEDRYELLSSYEMNAMGLIRYLQRRGQDRQDRQDRQDKADKRSATS